MSDRSQDINNDERSGLTQPIDLQSNAISDLDLKAGRLNFFRRSYG